MYQGGGNGGEFKRGPERNEGARMDVLKMTQDRHKSVRREGDSRRVRGGSRRIRGADGHGERAYNELVQEIHEKICNLNPH